MQLDEGGHRLGFGGAQAQSLGHPGKDLLPHLLVVVEGVAVRIGAPALDLRFAGVMEQGR